METVDDSQEESGSDKYPKKRKSTWKMLPGRSSESLALQVLLLSSAGMVTIDTGCYGLGYQGIDKGSLQYHQGCSVAEPVPTTLGGLLR